MKLYSTEEVCNIFGCSDKMLRYYRNKNVLKGIKVGHGWRYSEEELENFYNMFKGCDISNKTKVDFYLSK